MLEIRVQCYSGYRADERPLRFEFHGRSFEVAEVEDRWYSPGAVYFRVRATDGDFYVLRHDEGIDTWFLEAFRSSHTTATPSDPLDLNSPGGPHGAS